MSYLDTFLLLVIFLLVWGFFAVWARLGLEDSNLTYSQKNSYSVFWPIAFIIIIICFIIFIITELTKFTYRSIIEFIKLPRELLK